MLSPRQELLLGKVVEVFASDGEPVGSKVLASDPEITWGSSTVRYELAELQRFGLVAHAHSSSGRFPTDSGYRYYIDHLLPRTESKELADVESFDLSAARREIDEVMRFTTEALSTATNLLAIVCAPPLQTATIRHVEVLSLQPNVLMTVIITSTGGVSKRTFTFSHRIDPGIADWAASYLNEKLVGTGLGARTLHSRLADPSLPDTERAFIETIAPAFLELEDAAQDTVYADGAARLLTEYPFATGELNALLDMLERRVSLLGVLSAALGERDIYVRIGAENSAPALKSLSLVAANYGLPQRNLGTVSVIGPTRMNYSTSINAVREAASQLSYFIEDVYNA